MRGWDSFSSQIDELKGPILGQPILLDQSQKVNYVPLIYEKWTLKNLTHEFSVWIQMDSIFIRNWY